MLHPVSILNDVNKELSLSRERTERLCAIHAADSSSTEIKTAAMGMIKEERYFQAQLIKQQAKLTQKITFFPPSSAKKDLLITSNLLKLNDIYVSQFNNLEKKLSLHLKNQASSPRHC